MSRFIRRASVGAAIAVTAALAIPTTASAHPLTPVADNTPPVARPVSASVPENVARTIQLVGKDADGDTIVYGIGTQPVHGELTWVSKALGTVTYVPDRDYVGPDPFTYVVKDDNNALSAPGTVSVDVTKGNSHPVAYGQSVVTGQDTALPIVLDGDDPDAPATDSIEYSVVSGPSHGTLDGTAAALVRYTPNRGYVGPDELTFQVTDRGGFTARATVRITVLAPTPVNRPPVAANRSITTPLNTAVPVTLAGSDPDGNRLTYLVLTRPAHGTLTGAVPNLTYTPDAGFVGVDTLTYKVDDNALQSAKATVTITVAKPNSAPVAKNLSLATVQNRPVGVTLSAEDPDGDAITGYTASKPAHGTLSGTAPNLTYTPDRWFDGTDTFTYTATDGRLTSAPATVTIVVRGFKHRPVAYDQSVTTGKNHPVKIHLNGWSGDRGDLRFIVVDRPDHGRLLQHGDDVVYVPYRGFSGYDSFRFVVRDRDGDTSKAAKVSITVKRWWGGHDRF